jgi:hypothetical protein
MEIRNSRYQGEFKIFGEEFAQHPFFDIHRVFSASEVRRMQDTRFSLTISATILSTYFNRDDELEEYLERYNDEFTMREELIHELTTVLDFIDDLGLPQTSRLWKKADLFTAIVEVHKALFKRQWELSPEAVAKQLSKLYSEVDDSESQSDPESDASKYYKAALQATNDRGSRITRGEIIQKTLEGTLHTSDN